jgi:hypothetical protein
MWEIHIKEAADLQQNSLARQNGQNEDPNLSCTRCVTDVAALARDNPDFFPLCLAIGAPHTRHLRSKLVLLWSKRTQSKNLSNSRGG